MCLAMKIFLGKLEEFSFLHLNGKETCRNWWSLVKKVREEGNLIEIYFPLYFAGKLC